MTSEFEPTVFIVDDEQLLCYALSRLLRGAGFRVEVYTGAREFLDAYSPERAGCIVLDVQMPHMTGPDLQKVLTERGIDIPIIFLTAHSSVSLAVDAMRAGAVDFMEKPFCNEVLLARVQKAVELGTQFRERRRQRADTERKLALLTPREQQVMNMLIAGNPSKAIARELGISSRTVDIHRANIMYKLGAESVVELVRIAALVEEGSKHKQLP